MRISLVRAGIVATAQLVATPAGTLPVPDALLRDADIYAGTVAFVHADALWVGPLHGPASRLVVGDDVSTPRFSPDGSQLAYSIRVDENLDVYTIPVDGGIPSRLTWHPGDDRVVDWYPDGSAVLFKSARISERTRYNRLFRVQRQGGLPLALPVAYGETAALSADGATLVYTTMPDFQEEAWKRYRGGRAPDLWRLALESGDSQRLTRDPAPDSMPMFVGESLYFLSERGASGRSNLWRRDAGSGEPTQITHYTDRDVRRPSTDRHKIVFDLDGALQLFDPATGDVVALLPRVVVSGHDLAVRRRPAGRMSASASFAADGLIAIETRGDIVTMGEEFEGTAVAVGGSASAERYPSLSPDSTRLAYVSDRNGEYQLFVRDLASRTDKVLTPPAPGLIYQPHWSPDARWLAYMDERQRLFVASADGRGEPREVDRGRWRYHWDMQHFAPSWSPDSRWLAYAMAGDNRNFAIRLYSLETRQTVSLTSGFYSDFSPRFGPDGNYLFMLSRRRYEPVFGDIDPTFVYAGSTVVSALALRRDLAPHGTDAAPDGVERVSVDIAGAERRLRVLPIPPGNLTTLSSSDEGLLVSRAVTPAGEPATLALEFYPYHAAESRTVREAAAVKLLVNQRGQALVTSDDDLIRVRPDEDELGLPLDEIVVRVDPLAEYRQMFADGWRFQRDFFYDPALHGVDWPAVREHFEPLAARVVTDSELTWILREMSAELSAGHVYASAEAPVPAEQSKKTGLPGADFELHDGAYRFARVLTAGLREWQHRSPLTDAGVVAGDYLLAVNGLPVDTSRSPWAAFDGLAGEEATLRVATSPNGRGSREVTVTLLDSEAKLRELAWVERNRQYVAESSGGAIGYLYVPNTAREGQNELMQQFRAQYKMKALIVDERFNSGGALGDRFVELLNRPPLNYFRARNADDYALPEVGHRGPKAMLINGWSYSGGDGFPFLFKTARLGPLIGTRTWGGLIGPGMRMQLANGGFVSPPPQRVYDIEGRWAEGNEGVRPTIEVLNDPAELARGSDAQLDRAIAELMSLIDAVPPVRVPEYETR